MTSLARHQIAEGIERIERRVLDTGQPPALCSESFVRRLQFIHVHAMDRFWSTRNDDEVSQSVESRFRRMLSGLHGYGPCAFVVMGTPQQISLYLAFPLQPMSDTTLGAALSAALPGCIWNTVEDSQTITDGLGGLYQGVAITGNPAMRIPSDNGGHEEVDAPIAPDRLETVMRAMTGGFWAYLIYAEPMPRDTTDSELRYLDDEAQECRSSHQRPNSAEQHNNPQADRYLELLDGTRRNYRVGQREGMWNVYAYLLADDSIRLSRGVEAIRSGYGGRASGPQPLRIRACTPDGIADDSSSTMTCLNTTELVALAHPPSQEFPGYQLTTRVQFAIATPNVTIASRLSVGMILDRGQLTGNWLDMSIHDLTRHVLVAGVPGSGKTQTCQFLLRQLWEEHRIPWLVLEPSLKSEYRRLLHSPTGKDLRVFTLGDEATSPLRLNPLEIPPGLHVQTHIDAVSALFNAAFALVTPMPYVLRAAIQQVYVDRGWDLVSGTHLARYGPAAQPTLEDLLRTLDRLVRELGYDGEITGNIRAGLNLRLSSLTTGIKGRLLNCLMSTPMDYLLQAPAVFEMSAIGDDEEKAFVLGTLILRLAEHRQIEGLSEGKLRHVLLIEEAHRLLSATSRSNESEAADARGAAVEMFCNLLAEIRAMGQGIVAVDQAPTKLSPDLVRNTNLKIAHRVVAEDDRKVLAGSMNLTDEQSRHLATLATGRAVVYAEGREAAFKVRVPNCTLHVADAMPSREHILAHMNHRLPPPPSNPTPGAGNDARGSDPQDRGGLPGCPGCRGNCELRGAVMNHLLGEFNGQTGTIDLQDWQSVWRFGYEIARQIWPVRMPPSAPYCVMMNIAAVADYELEVVDAMRRNLGVLRDHSDAGEDL